MASVELLYLSQEDVIASGGLDMPQTLRAVEEAIGLLARGGCVLPSKTVLRWGDEKTSGRVNAMPAYVGGTYDMAGIKWIGGFPGNPVRHNLPRGSGLIVLNSSETGLPVVVMDGTVVSAMRTGAVTGVAAKYLARSESEVVGLVGAGVQNRTQLMAVAAVLPKLKQAFVSDIAAERAATFAREMSAQLGFSVAVAVDAEALARQSDVLITATTAANPVVREGWWSAGCFYSHVGSYQECTFAMIAEADKVVTDHWAEVLHRGSQSLARMHLAGQFPAERLHADLGDIINAQALGRTNSAERIHFCPIGMGIEDIAVATLIYRRALAEGRGQRLVLWEKAYAV